MLRLPDLRLIEGRDVQHVHAVAEVEADVVDKAANGVGNGHAVAGGVAAIGLGGRTDDKLDGVAVETDVGCIAVGNSHGDVVGQRGAKAGGGENDGSTRERGLDDILVRVTSEGDDIAGEDGARTSVERDGGVANGIARGIVDEVARASALGHGGHASGFANREAVDVQQLATAKGGVVAGLVDVGELGQRAQSGTGRGVDDEVEIVERGSVVRQDLSKLGGKGQLVGRIKGRGPGGAVSARRALVGDGADVRFDGVADLSERLRKHAVDGLLILADVLQLLHVLAAQRDADVGNLAYSDGLGGDGLVIAGRDGHRRGVAGVKRGLRGDERVNRSIDRHLRGVAVHEHGGDEADKLAADGVASAEDVFRERSEGKGVSHCIGWV